MKRILLLVLLAANMLIANAQDNWYQYGIKIGTSFPTARAYSFDGDYLSGSGNADFGVFFRAGRYVFGEVGFGYSFLKGVYDYYIVDTVTLYRDKSVTTHYLQIPVKVVGNVPISKTVTFLPHAGIIYQPLVKITDNSIGFSKKTLNTNQVFVTGGFDFKLGPILLGVNYRYSIQNFFRNKDGKHPQFVNICAGIQL